MKRIMTFLAAAAAVTLPAGAHAADAKAAEALAKNSGCFACHTVDKKLIGPSYKDIAAKYRNDKGAEANLVKKVKAGGKGVWGDIPMAPNAHVKDADLKTIVQWVLSIK
ncbi:MAG: cytochrome C [Betaproteobacteria bacterium RIFCSPLOWO2_02_FULL_67_26]|nr:MAG: cytochrome C [Betaproteobacteria bacterium RIFCSPLOWO2_02_FULL_67_26]